MARPITRSHGTGLAAGSTVSVRGVPFGYMQNGQLSATSSIHLQALQHLEVVFFPHTVPTESLINVFCAS